jgi:hypothetical protein
MSRSTTPSRRRLWLALFLASLAVAFLATFLHAPERYEVYLAACLLAAAGLTGLAGARAAKICAVIGLLFSALSFYLIRNSVSQLTLPRYARLAGFLIAALWGYDALMLLAAVWVSVRGRKDAEEA